MERLTRSFSRALAAVVLLGLTLLAPGAAEAATVPKIQQIARFGDRAGSIKIDGHFDIGTLNDRGQIVFVTENPNGDEVLVQYAEGKLTPIVDGGGDAPGGKWGTNNGIEAPVNMNQLGNIVFATDLTAGNSTDVGTFLWEYQAQRITTVARPGMPAVLNRTFVTGGGATPAINDRNEIALVAAVKDAAGDTQEGVFFRGSDGKLQPVALPDQPLPDGRKVGRAYEATINDAGMVAFLARRQGDGAHTDSAYVWENGTLTPVALVGQQAPGGGTIVTVWAALVNNSNRNVVIAARLNNSSKGPDAVYLFANGKLTQAAIPGQPMPDGGKFQTLQSDRDGISFANTLGQHAIVAALEDKSTAVYRMDVDGKLSPILKSGAVTDLGKVTHVGVPVPSKEPEGVGVSINSRGQVALTLKINGGPTMVALLTQAGP